MSQKRNWAQPDKLFDRATINIRNLRLRTFDKPHALRFAESVSLTLEYTPNIDDTFNLLEKAS